MGGIMRKSYINRTSKAYRNAQRLGKVNVEIFTSTKDYLERMHEDFDHYLEVVKDQVKEELKGYNCFDLILYEDKIKREKKKAKGEAFKLASEILLVIDHELINRYLIEQCDYYHKRIPLKEWDYPLLDHYDRYMEYVHKKQHQFANVFQQHVIHSFRNDFISKLKPEQLCLLYEGLASASQDTTYGAYYFTCLLNEVETVMLSDLHYLHNICFHACLKEVY